MSRNRARALSLTLVLTTTPHCASGVTRNGDVFVIMDAVTASSRIQSTVIRRKLKLDVKRGGVRSSKPS
jgi:hypothetical protein